MLTLAVALWASPASATLLSTDWLTSGDGLLTRDDATGLEWLDWSYTAGRSFDDVSSEFGGGAEFEGFRYATLTDLQTLYLSSVGFNSIGGVDPLNDPLTAAFAALFSQTLPPFHSYALYDYSTAIGKHWVTLVTNGNGNVDVTFGQVTDSWTESYIGSALVRDTAAVPGPSTLLLLGTSLAGVAIRRRIARRA